MNRFDYVLYDAKAQADQGAFKGAVQNIEARFGMVSCSEYVRTNALRALEEFYMWVGKAIRDEQLLRNGGAPLQEERNSS